MSVTIGRSWRFPGDYDHVSDFIDAVERESCHGCAHGGFDPDLPSLECPVTLQVLGYRDEERLEVHEWDEVEPAWRIRCRARYDGDPGHAPIPGLPLGGRTEGQILLDLVTGTQRLADVGAQDVGIGVAS